MASVNLSLEEFEELKARSATAYNEVANLKEALRAARSADPNNTIRDVTDLARDMLQIVRFAMANCPPSEIRGWPLGSLSAVAHGLKSLPDHADDDATLAIELEAFAREATQAEADWARKHQERSARFFRENSLRVLDEAIRRAARAGDRGTASQLVEEYDRIAATP